MRTPKLASLLAVLTTLTFAQSKPKLTLDDFFNAVSFPKIAISPDGNSVVMVAERADWDQQILRADLWLSLESAQGGSLIQMPQSGHDNDPQWAPDGHWIAFLSERKVPSSDSDDEDDKSKHGEKNNDDKSDKSEVAQIYLISPTGGEAIQITQGAEEVHAFSWSADSRSLYYATRNPWTKAQKDEYKKHWKDVVQYRTAERGDTIFSLDLAGALAHHAPAPAKEAPDSEKDSDLTPGARVLATSPLRVDDLVTSPDGAKLAFVTNSINQRQEKFEDVELYVVSVGTAHVAAGDSPENERSEKSAPLQPRQLTHNQAVEVRPRWANDSRHIFFTVEVGDVSGPY